VTQQSTHLCLGYDAPGGQIVVADESHFLKSFDAKRTQATVPLLQVRTVQCRPCAIPQLRAASHVVC